MSFITSVTGVEWIGYLAALLVFSTFYMKTMLPLRTVAIFSNVAFMTYAFLADLAPVLILHSVLFPLNVVRLYQLRRLLERVRRAASGTFSMERILTHMSREELKAGRVIFRKDDKADKLYYIHSGSVTLLELGKTLGPGAIVGEIGVFSPDGKRMATATCETDSVLLVLSSEMALQLYFQNPEFGMHMIQLVTQRLLESRGTSLTN